MTTSAAHGPRPSSRDEGVTLVDLLSMDADGVEFEPGRLSLRGRTVDLDLAPTDE